MDLGQSESAIANGGFWGTGLFHGAQTNLSYVPEQKTDFIFSAVGEQLGFVGTAIVLALVRPAHSEGPDERHRPPVTRSAGCWRRESSRFSRSAFSRMSE